MKTFLLLLIPALACSQYQNLYFIKMNNRVIRAHVYDIRNDSIYYSIYPATADTMAVHPTHLKRLRLISDPAQGFPSGYSLTRLQYKFVNSTSPLTFKVLTDTVYNAIYELVPYIGYQGLGRKYRPLNKTYHDENIGQPKCKDTARPPVTRNFAWYTPSGATTINGLSIGIQTINIHGDPMTINGVNLNADVLSGIAGMYGLIYMVALLPSGKLNRNAADTLPKEKPDVFINGLSISGGGLLFPAQIKGVSINGGICIATDLKGMVIAGVISVVEDFHGVNIAGVYNRSVKGNGLQIGLVNLCKDLKGIQVGLWNVNSKRKLPLINWRF